MLATLDTANCDPLRRPGGSHLQGQEGEEGIRARAGGDYAPLPVRPEEGGPRRASYGVSLRLIYFPLLLFPTKQRRNLDNDCLSAALFSRGRVTLPASLAKSWY